MLFEVYKEPKEVHSLFEVLFILCDILLVHIQQRYKIYSDRVRIYILFEKKEKSRILCKVSL